MKFRRDWIRIARTKTDRVVNYVDWSSEAAKYDHTVFGKHVDGLAYEYADRLIGEKWFEASKLADIAGLQCDTVKFFEFVIKYIHDYQRVNIKHIAITVNRSTGYSILIFGYTYREKKTEPTKVKKKKVVRTTD